MGTFGLLGVVLLIIILEVFWYASLKSWFVIRGVIRTIVIIGLSFIYSEYFKYYGFLDIQTAWFILSLFLIRLGAMRVISLSIPKTYSPHNNGYIDIIDYICLLFKGKGYVRLLSILFDIVCIGVIFLGIIFLDMNVAVK